MRYKNLTISTGSSKYARLQEISIHQLSRFVDKSLFFSSDRAAQIVFENGAQPLSDELISNEFTPWGSPAEIFTANVDENHRLNTDGLTALNLFNVSIFPICSLAVYDDKFIVREYQGVAYHANTMHWLRKNYSFFGLRFEITKYLSSPSKLYPCGIDFSVDIGDKNVFHWIGRVLPKIKFLKELPNDWPLVFSYQPTEFQLETLKIFGILNPILIIERNQITKFDKYIFLEGAWSSCNRGMMDYLRGSLLPLCKSSNKVIKKLYVYREASWTRCLLNRDEISEFLVSKGYTLHSLSGTGLVDTIEIFQSADEIIFEHGAAGIFLMFTKPSVKVLEVNPSKVHVSAKETTNFFFWLSAILERSYDCIVCQNIRNEPWAEFRLDPLLLQDRMQALGME